jgi:hypothetical protein
MLHHIKQTLHDQTVVSRLMVFEALPSCEEMAKLDLPTPEKAKVKWRNYRAEGLN